MKKLTLSALIIGILASLPVGARMSDGVGSGGGGNATEADMRHFMGRIDSYLQTTDGKAAFPEIVEYDHTHPEESFHELIGKVNPVVKPGEIRDALGEVRDCQSVVTPTLRYFRCNSDALPEMTLNNQPTYYRIVFHELLVQAGIEKPISNAVPSQYNVSSRIMQNVHLATYQEWVPGKSETMKNEFVEQAQQLFKNDTKASFRELNQLSWNNCSGVYLGGSFKLGEESKTVTINGTTMTSVTHNEKIIFENPQWLAFPESMSFEWNSLTDNLFAFKDGPNLPYYMSNSRTNAESFKLVSPSILYSNEAGTTQLSAKLVDSKTIVVEAALAYDTRFRIDADYYNGLKAYAPQSVRHSNFVPFAYFICKNR